MRSHSPVKVVVQVALIGLLLAVSLNFDRIVDSYTLATYHPTATIGAIESRLSLTQAARAILYRANPVVDDKHAFNSDCQTVKGELELGCFYHSRIYILAIDNPSLQPEMDAVTAHELLHAAWGRMSVPERTDLSRELERVYAGITDSDLRSRMTSYARSEPGEQDNELNSILGTEYASLSPVLEAHYAHYFTDRAKIVAAHQSYQNVFNSRRQELEGELSTIRSLKGSLASLNGQMAAYRRDGQTSSYNALVPRQNSLVDDINRRIDAYRRGVDEYNALSQSLDSQQITDTESSVN